MTVNVSWKIFYKQHGNNTNMFVGVQHVNNEHYVDIIIIIFIYTPSQKQMSSSEVKLKQKGTPLNDTMTKKSKWKKNKKIKRKDKR